MRNKNVLIVFLTVAAWGWGCRRLDAGARAQDPVRSSTASVTGVPMSPRQTGAQQAQTRQMGTRQVGTQQTPRPVRTTQFAPIAQGQDVAAALKKTFKDSWDVQVGKSHARRHLRNCADYLDLGTDDIQTEDPADLAVFLGQASLCQALNWLRQARPSLRSFLDGLQVDTQAPRWLPASFYLDLAPDEEASMAAATLKGQTWQAFDPEVHGDSTVDATSRAHFIGHGYDAYVSEYARGDFDHDGIEDILIARTAYAAEGSMTDYTIFLLTRINDQPPLQERPDVPVQVPLHVPVRVPLHVPIKILKVWRQAC